MASSYVIGNEEINPLLHHQFPSLLTPHGNSNNKSAVSSGVGPSITSVSKLLEILECPVCTNLMHPTIYQCRNGHTLCSTCKTRVHNRCPTCRLELDDIRCIALDKVAEVLKLPCKYKSLGCLEILPYCGKLKVEHESLCNFRPYSCPYGESECPVVGDIQYLFAHLRDDHKVDVLSGWTFRHCCVKSNPRELKKFKWTLIVFHLFGQYFCLHLEAFWLEKDLVCMPFVCFMGDEIEALNYRYSVQVSINGSIVTWWPGTPRSIRDSCKKVRDCRKKFGNSLYGPSMRRYLAFISSRGDAKQLTLQVAGWIGKKRQNLEARACIPNEITEYSGAEIAHLKKALEQAIATQEELKMRNNNEVQKYKETIDDLNKELGNCSRTIDAKNSEVRRFQIVLDDFNAKMEAKERSEIDLALAREESAKLSGLLRDADEREEQSKREKEEILAKLSHAERILAEGKSRVNKLEEDNAKLMRALEQSMTRLNRMSMDSDYLVDSRMVIKLLVTYFQRNHSKEVLDLMVRMLGFSDEDKHRIGIAQQGAGEGVVRGVLGLPGRLFAGILGGGSADVQANIATDNHSIADLGVNFLLKETEERETRESRDELGKSKDDPNGKSPKSAGASGPVSDYRAGGFPGSNFCSSHTSSPSPSLASIRLSKWISEKLESDIALASTESASCSS